MQKALSSSSSSWLSLSSTSSSSSSSSLSTYFPSTPLLSPPSMSAPPSPPATPPALDLPLSAVPQMDCKATPSVQLPSFDLPSTAVPNVDSKITNAYTYRSCSRKHTYRKKRNISGDGTLYERDFATICFLRGVHRHEDFYLTAAVDALHPFDDVQFETIDPKLLRSSVIQLKHKHGKTLTKEALQGLRGDRSTRGRWRDKSFVIHVFHAGFCRICDMADEIQEQFGFTNRFGNWEFILYTNCAVEENNGNDIWNAIATTGCGNRDIATCEECPSGGAGCFLLKDTYQPWQRFNPDFLDKFRLYAGQAGENDMEQIIHNEISANKSAWGEEPTEVIAYNLCNFIEKWLTKETLPLDASIKDKFLKKLQIKKNSSGYVPWFPLD